MPAVSSWLPPFPALRAFHAAARHSRFRDAAKALGVTESAISHQVRRLEDFLHLQLFERNGPQVRLSAAGRRYFDEIDPALLSIGEATRRAMGPAERSRVALTLPPSLAVLWMIPNLGAFEQAHPDIDLQLVTTTRLCDLRREQIDLAVRYGRGRWSDVEAEFLLAETTMPVCRPDFLEADAIRDPQAVLSSNRLIINGFHPDEWSEWARARGIDLPGSASALRRESREQVLEAAEHGLGLAIGRRPQVDERLRTGALVAPFGMPDPSETGYYLCLALAATPTAAARRVARWLRRLAKDAAANPGIRAANPANCRPEMRE